MKARVEARLEKVKRASRAARRVCFWLMALISLGTAVLLAATLAIPESLTCDVNGFRRLCSELSPQAVAFSFVGVIAGVALAMTALYRLARLFQHYSRGEIFTRESVREIRVLGYVAVAYALFQLVMFVATLSLIASGAIEAVGDMQVELPLAPAVVASLILLLSWVMDVGAELREENELTV